jgi:putative intracellular protease/amidase
MIVVPGRLGGLTSKVYPVSQIVANQYTQGGTLAVALTSPVAMIFDTLPANTEVTVAPLTPEHFASNSVFQTIFDLKRMIWSS